MDKAQERYLDVATEAFMEQYAALLEESIQKEMVQNHGEKWAFPQKLDIHCRELLENQRLLQRRAARKKRLRRILCSAAVLLMVLAGTFSILLSSADAVRIAFMNFIIEKTDFYWKFTAAEEKPLPEVFNEDDPLGMFLPEDFSLTLLNKNSEVGIVVANYRNNEDCAIFFSMETSYGNLHIDTEGAQVTQFILNGHDAVMAEEGIYIRILWLDENASSYFTLISENMSVEDMLHYAGCISTLFN